MLFSPVIGTNTGKVYMSNHTSSFWFGIIPSEKLSTLLGVDSGGCQAIGDMLGWDEVWEKVMAR